MSARAGIEVQVFGEATPQPGRFRRWESAVTVDRSPVAATADSESAAAAYAAVQFRFDDDPGSDLVGQRTVGAGDPAYHLMSEHEWIDHIGATAFPYLDVSA